MSRWEEAFINSHIQQHLSKTQNLLRQGVFKGIQKPHDSELKRVKIFTDVAGATIKKVDPNIAPIDHVNALANVLSTINTHLDNYKSTSDPSHLQQAANQIDGGINNLQHISLMLSDRPIVSNAILQRLLKKVNDNVVQMSKKRSEYTTKINNLKKQITTQEKKVKTIDTEALRKVKTLDKQITTFRKQFTVQQENIKKEFQTDQRQRRSSFNKYFSGFKNTLSNERTKLFNQFKKDIENKKTDTTSKLDQLITNSRTKHDELISIVGLASGDAIRGQHHIAAIEEKKSFVFWRRVSFGSLIIAVILVSIISLAKGMSVNTSIMMAPFLALLLSGAVYSARLAAGHRREAIRVRQFSLEMEAILPYLDALERSPADSKELRNKLAEKFFGNLPPVEAGQHKNEAQLSDSIIQKFTDSVTKITNWNKE